MTTHLEYTWEQDYQGGEHRQKKKLNVKEKYDFAYV